MLVISNRLTTAIIYNNAIGICCWFLAIIGKLECRDAAPVLAKCSLVDKI